MKELTAKVLEGKRVTQLEINQDQSMLCFTVLRPDENGDCCEEYTFEVEGDCCSETWFADLIGAYFLIGNTVRDVEEVQLPPPGKADKRTRQEYDQIYGIRINRGDVYIIFRNSSNGYYGGALKVHAGRRAGQTWSPVTEDMSW